MGLSLKSEEEPLRVGDSQKAALFSFKSALLETSRNGDEAALRTLPRDEMTTFIWSVLLEEYTYSNSDEYNLLA